MTVLTLQEVGVYVNRLLGYIDGFVNFTVNAVSY